MKLKAMLRNHEDQSAYIQLVDYCLNRGIVMLTTNSSDGHIDIEFIDNGQLGVLRSYLVLMQEIL